MKQIINKEDKAVSPIIATILLIAITVVLAATLYTVLGGFTKGLSSGNPTATANFVESSTNASDYTISFASISGNISVSSVELQLYNGTTVSDIALHSGQSSGSGGINQLNNVNYTISGDSTYISITTTISISTYHGQNTTKISHSGTITALAILDTSTSSTIVAKQSVSASVIYSEMQVVSPEIFRF